MNVRSVLAPSLGCALIGALLIAFAPRPFWPAVGVGVIFIETGLYALHLIRKGKS